MAKNVRFWITGVVAVTVIAAIGIGAYKGRTRLESPSDTLAAKANAEGTTTVQTGTAKKELIPIKTATRKNCTLAPILVADKKGFFEEEGLKLTFTGELGANQLLPTVINGNNDFGDAHPNYLAVAIAGGAKVTGVARSIIEPGPNEDPALRHMRWYVSPKAPVKNFADLKNYKAGQQLKISGTKNSCSEFLANTIADNAGTPRDKFEYVTFDSDLQAIQATSQGILDIAGVHPTFFKAAEDAGLVQIADSSDSKLGEAAGIYLYYFTNDFINKNPDVVQHFVNAVTKAQKWANANRKETAQWTEEFIGVPVTGNHFFSQTTKINEEHIKPWLVDLVKFKVIPEGKVAVGDIITHKFEKE